MTNTIEVNGITKRYGQHVAVDDLTFEVHEAEIFSMLGPNGAGKTSTIRMILDIIKPDRGEIKVLNAHFTEATKAQIGYLPEERGLYKGVKVLELLTYLGTLKGMKSAEASRRASQLIDEVGLGENKNSKVSELSRGMSQKVQFIATILHHPKLIIVDEPFSGLDPVNTEMIKTMLYKLKREGLTIVMSIHEMYQVEEMADRLLMIDRGKRMLYGSVDEVRQQYAENAVVVEGTGDWSKIPGVSSVKSDEKGRHATLLLNDQTTPDQIMQTLAASNDYHIRSFAVAVPSLNDIFIRVAGGNNQNNHNNQNGAKEDSHEPEKSMAHR